MEKILDWKKGIEDDHSNSFAVKAKEVRRKNTEIDDLLDEYEELKSNMIALRAPHELAQVHLYRDQLADQITRERGYLSKLNDELENIKIDLIQARKDKMAIEKLKEKDFEKHKEKVKKQEQDFLDEVATLRHIHKEDD